MTDISNWEETIHIMKIQDHNKWTGAPNGYNEKLMIPINEYQMANLIDAIAQVPDTGDWFGEFCDIVASAMAFLNIKELRSNNGRVFTYNQIRARDIRKKDEETPA